MNHSNESPESSTPNPSNENQMGTEDSNLRKTSSFFLRPKLLIGVFFLLLIATLLVGLSVGLNRMYTRKDTTWARVQMRNLATGIESYFIDNMAYPGEAIDPSLSVDQDHLGFVPSRAFMNASALNHTLTTPIAYISEYPPDPFHDKLETFRYAQTSSSFLIGSFGPDYDAKTGGDVEWHIGTINPDDHTWPYYKMVNDRLENNWTNDQLKDILATATNSNGIAYTYDSSNGLHSEGDILRLKD